MTLRCAPLAPGLGPLWRRGPRCGYHSGLQSKHADSTFDKLRQLGRAVAAALRAASARATGPRTRNARLGLLALGLQSLQGLALGTVLVCADCFAGYCRVVDASLVSAGFETLVVFAPSVALLIADDRALRRAEGVERWRRWSSRGLILVSLGYTALYLAVLRGPWLLGRAGADDRITLWSARLSSTSAGIPLVGFALAVGMGINHFCVSAACVRAVAADRASKSRGGAGRFEVAVWLLCAAIVALEIAAVTTFATGGQI